MSDKRHASTSSSQANEPSVPIGQGGWMDPEPVERCRALKLVTTLTEVCTVKWGKDRHTGQFFGSPIALRFLACCVTLLMLVSTSDIST